MEEAIVNARIRREEEIKQKAENFVREIERRVSAVCMGMHPRLGADAESIKHLCDETAQMCCASTLAAIDGDPYRTQWLIPVYRDRGQKAGETSVWTNLRSGLHSPCALWCTITYTNPKARTRENERVIFEGPVPDYGGVLDGCIKCQIMISNDNGDLGFVYFDIRKKRSRLLAQRAVIQVLEEQRITGEILEESKIYFSLEDATMFRARNTYGYHVALWVPDARVDRTYTVPPEYA